MEKSVVMTFRVSPEDAAKIREAVGEGSFSEYVRAKLLPPATQIERDPSKPLTPNPHLPDDEPEWKRLVPSR